MNRISEFINSNKLKINYVNDKLNIVNFNEILLLSDEKIILSKENKIITIKGNNLTLLKLLDNEILIDGCIKIIEM